MTVTLTEYYRTPAGHYCYFCGVFTIVLDPNCMCDTCRQVWDITQFPTVSLAGLTR